MAADHGFLNPFPHRAVTDALTMLKLAGMYDWDETIKRSKSPIRTLIANVSFENKDLAKSAGFHWIAETKQWMLDIKECDLERTTFEFKTKEATNGIIK